jgi:hypothetical protein
MVMFILQVDTGLDAPALVEQKPSAANGRLSGFQGVVEIGVAAGSGRSKRLGKALRDVGGVELRACRSHYRFRCAVEDAGSGSGRAAGDVGFCGT